MAAPQIRDLQSLIDQYSASFNPQKQLIETDLAGLDAAGTAQEQGLAAKQNTAFKNIEQTAQNKGMFFSGFSPDAQASYTADTYLPALAQLQATIAQGRSSLLGKRADIDSQARTQAINAQEGDRQALTAYEQMQQQQAFQAEQARLEREAAAAENAKNRSASAANSKSKTPTQAQFLVSAFSGYDPDTMKFYTEREVIPALKANYGLSDAEAKRLAYTYRKSAYGS